MARVRDPARVGWQFHRATVIPERVWLEAIVNAVVHRSYSIGGDHIRVSLFTDRLEVESPGRLPGLVRIETIRSTRFARNPRVARTVLEFGFGRSSARAWTGCSKGWRRSDSLIPSIARGRHR